MIIKNESEVKTTIFEDLDIGDPFMYEGYVFMKIDKINATDEDGFEDIYNAVCLSDGDLHGFTYSAEVSIPKIEVVITK